MTDKTTQPNHNWQCSCGPAVLSCKLCSFALSTWAFSSSQRKDFAASWQGNCSVGGLLMDGLKAGSCLVFLQVIPQLSLHPAIQYIIVNSRKKTRGSSLQSHTISQQMAAKDGLSAGEDSLCYICLGMLILWPWWGKTRPAACQCFASPLLYFTFHLLKEMAPSKNKMNVLRILAWLVNLNT